MKAIYIDPQGIVKYIAELPERPDLGLVIDATSANTIQGNYNKALQAAKDSAVEFQDQKQITSILRRYYSDGNLLWSPGLDALHPFPSDQYEVEVRDENPENQSFSHSGAYAAAMQAYRGSVAVITPKKSEPVESQEERFIPEVQVLNVGGRYAVTFTVGVQTFTLDYHEAEWMAEQLTNALNRVKTI